MAAALLHSYRGTTRLRRGCSRSAAVGVLAVLTVLAASPSARAQCDADLVRHYGGDAAQVTRAGNLVYCSFGNEVFVYDVSAINSPVELGSILIAGDQHHDIVARGDYAYIAAGESGLVVINATNPAAPAIAARLGLPQAVHRAAINGDTLYLSSGWDANGSEAYVIDVTTPSAPSVESTYITVGDYEADGVAAKGNWMYVATNGLEIVSVANPAAPTLSSTYQDFTSFDHVAVGGDILVAIDFDDLHVLDASTPGSPVPLSVFQLPHPANEHDSTLAINPDGTLVFVGSDDFPTETVTIIDISTPTSPVVLGAIEETIANDLYASQLVTFVARRSGGLECWGDLTTTPAQRWNIVHTPAAPDVFAAVDDFAMLPITATTPNRLRILNTSVPGAPSVAAEFNVAQPIVAMAADGNLLCVAESADESAGPHRLQVVNLAASPPNIVSTRVLPIAPTSVGVSGSIAVVGESGATLRIFDLTIPASPLERGLVDLVPVVNSGAIWQIHFFGDYLAVSSFSDVYIVSIANLDAPQVLYQFNGNHPSPPDSAISGGHLFILDDYDDEVEIYSLANPAAPALAATYFEGDFDPKAIVAREGLLAVFDEYPGSYEISLVDVSNPAGPVRIDAVPANPGVRRLHLTWDRLWRVGDRVSLDFPANPGLYEISLPGLPDVTTLPADQATCPGHLVTVGLQAVGSPTYRWRRNGIPVNNGLTGHGSSILGALSDTLFIFNAQGADSADYDCVVSNACGDTVIPAMTLTICDGCVGDTNCDCRQDLTDLATLLANFGMASGATREMGDLTGDGAVNLTDLATLLGVFGAACS